MIDFSLELSTDEILLRPLLMDDIKPIAALTSDPSMWIYFTSDLSVQSELEQWVATAVDQTKAHQRLAFAIIHRPSNQLIGSTSLGNISLIDQRIEIGWTWIARSFQGKGINDEVKKLLLAYCFDVLNFERVELKTDVLNVYARKAMLRIGFREEGVLRSHTLMTHHRRRDSIYYSLLKSEWNALKKSL